MRRALAPSLLALVSRCRRAAQRARPGGGPHDNLALGPALRSRAGGEAALSSQAKPQVLACDEAYVRVKGRWCFLYRAIDSTGAMIDFMLSGLRDAAAAKHLFRKALTDPSHPQPRVINTDLARLYRGGDFRNEKGRNPATPLPSPADPILEQHPGAGSSSEQTTSEGQAGLS